MAGNIKGFRVTKDGKIVRNQPKKSVSQRIASKSKKRVVSKAKALHHESK